MIIEGAKLLLTIAQQDVPLRVLNAEGRLEREFPNPKAALSFVAQGGYFGRGNHRRVSCIQPINGSYERAVFAGLKTDRIKGYDGTDGRRPDRLLMPEVPLQRRPSGSGKLTWPKRPDKAHSGISAKVRSVRFPKTEP